MDEEVTESQEIRSRNFAVLIVFFVLFWLYGFFLFQFLVAVVAFVCLLADFVLFTSIGRMQQG